jgi:hypothetical protein
MKQLVLQFSESRLQLFETGSNHPLLQRLPIDLNKPFAKDHISSAIKELLSNYTINEIMWFGSDFTLFPMALFDAQHIASYYQLNLGTAANDRRLTYQLLEKEGIALIYSIPVWLYDYAKYELQHPTVTHTVARLIKYNTALIHTSQVTICIEEEQFVMIANQDGRMLNASANSYQQQTDILYFLLAQQQKLQLVAPVSLHLFDATGNFDDQLFLNQLQQFKDFEHYQINFQPSTSYQNQILCAL